MSISAYMKLPMIPRARIDIVLYGLLSHIYCFYLLRDILLKDELSLALLQANLIEEKREPKNVSTPQF